MTIAERTELLRKTALLHGDYKNASEQAGVTESWLSKFADGRIQNPTVSNLAKIEAFFNNQIQPTSECTDC